MSEAPHSDGITESIIDSLSQLPRLRVMSRSTAFRYKGRVDDPRGAGRELGVGAVLTGRVLQVGDRLVVSAELVDVANGWQLWGEQYNRKAADIFGVQAEIAREIAERFRLRLTGEEQKRLGKRHTENGEAYRAYLRGRYFWNRRTREGIVKGIESFEEAIGLDPDYALAYAGLGRFLPYPGHLQRTAAAGGLLESEGGGVESFRDRRDAQDREFLCGALSPRTDLRAEGDAGESHRRASNGLGLR